MTPSSTPYSGSIYRTPEQKKYRNELAEKLSKLRKQWSEGKEIAEVLLSKENKTDTYKEAQEWRSLSKVFEDMSNFMEEIDVQFKNYDDKESQLKRYSYYGKDKFMKDSLYLFNLLEKENISLDDSQRSLIEKIISFGFDKYGNTFYYYASGTIMNEHNGSLDLLWRNVALNFLDQNFNAFEQSQKEAFILKALEESDFIQNTYHLEKSIIDWDFEGFPRKYHREGRYVRPTNSIWSNGTDYYFSSKYGLSSLVKQTVNESSNEQFLFNMLMMNAKYKFGSNIFPEKHLPLLRDQQKIMQFVTPEKLKDLKIRTNDLFSLFQSLEITIPRNIAQQWSESVTYVNPEKWYEKSENGFFGRENIKVLSRSQKVIEMDTVKIALEMILEKQEVQEEEFKMFKTFFDVVDLWKLVDEKYTTPTFINSKIDQLSPILGWKSTLWLLENYSKKLNEKSDKDVKKKFNWAILPWYEEAPVDLVVKTIDVDTLSDSQYTFELYDYLKQQNISTEKYLTKMLNNSRSSLETSHVATNFMQDIYSMNDDDLVKNMYLQFSRFSEKVSEEEMNILIQKMLKLISTEQDFEFFVKVMNNNLQNSDLLLMINYLLTGKINASELKKYRTIPSSLYKKMIIDWSFDSLDAEELPRAKPDPFIDSNDLQNLVTIYTIREEKRKKKAEEDKVEKERLEQIRIAQYEEAEKLKNDVIEHWEKWEVILDYSSPEQKFVLSVDTEKRVLEFLSENLPFHATIHSKYVKNGYCVGGGRIKMDENSKILYLYGYSESYGRVPGEYQSAMIKMLEKQYPAYRITLS